MKNNLHKASTAELRNFVDCEYRMRSDALKKQGRKAMIKFLKENFWDVPIKEITITPPVRH